MPNDDVRYREFYVEGSQAGMRLDAFLTHKIARLSRTQAQKCIDAGAVTLEPHRLAKSSLKVQEGEKITLMQKMREPEPDYDSIQCVAETDDFICFNKPAGMLVHPTAHVYRNCLTVYAEKVLKQRLYVVHRLDKESSGLTLLAKSPQVSAELAKIFSAQAIERYYRAIVYDPQSIYAPGKCRDIHIPLGFAGQIFPQLTMGRGHQAAHTQITPLAREGSVAMLSLALHTGRQHQIRVHLSLLGTPILGDKLYFFGESFYKDYLDQAHLPPYVPERHLLHAERLVFAWRGKRQVYHADMPEGFALSLFSDLNASYFPSDYARTFQSGP